MYLFYKRILNLINHSLLSLIRQSCRVYTLKLVVQLRQRRLALGLDRSLILHVLLSNKLILHENLVELSLYEEFDNRLAVFPYLLESW